MYQELYEDLKWHPFAQEVAALMQQAQHELLDPTIPFQDKAAKMVQHLDVMHERTRYINSITLETEQSRLEAQQGCLAAQERQLQLWQAAMIARREQRQQMWQRQQPVLAVVAVLVKAWKHVLLCAF
jgi:hypothetical protein